MRRHNKVAAMISQPYQFQVLNLGIAEMCSLDLIVFAGGSGGASGVNSHSNREKDPNAQKNLANKT